MAKLTYKEQLLHPNWQRKRLEMLESAKWTCSSCQASDKTLHVHHRMYMKGKMAWEYDNSLLAVLCEDCHQSEHDSEEMLKIITSGSAFHTPPARVAAGLLAGYMYGADALHEEYASFARDVIPVYFILGALAHQLAICNSSHLLSILESLPEETPRSKAYDELLTWVRTRTPERGPDGANQND